MTSQVVQFTSLSEHDRKGASHLPKLGEDDQVELRALCGDGQEQALALPPITVSILGTMPSHLLGGERMMPLSEDQELSPTDDSTILDISCPLVVNHMDIGDLLFRYVGKHRRTLLKDILSLKAKLELRLRQWKPGSLTPKTSIPVMVFSPLVAGCGTCIINKGYGKAFSINSLWALDLGADRRLVGVRNFAPQSGRLWIANA